MFSGLSAFPLTPMNDECIDEAAFSRLVERLVNAGVDSICALGSTGNYAYLTVSERVRITELSVRLAGSIPVLIGIGALRTRDVLELAHAAQEAGACGVLLAPVSYQALADDEVFDLYKVVTQSISIPLVVYDNPVTTHFEFSDRLLGQIAELPNVASIKIPGLPTKPEEARARIRQLRSQIPDHVTVGVSGDIFGATGLNAGCEAWYSVIGGLFPQIALNITRVAQEGRSDDALRLSEGLEPLWGLFRRYGSLRVVAAAAEALGLVNSPSLPLPLRAITGEDRQRLNAMIDELGLR
ncbi:dihydrodipicolinate synthase family protein [Alcanivoracaceae bacterium MT1]